MLLFPLRRDEAMKGDCSVLKNSLFLGPRWVVERCFAWLTRNRRLAKGYECKVQTSETLIEVAMIRLLVAWLGRRGAGPARLLL
jgi:transposase